VLFVSRLGVEAAELLVALDAEEADDVERIGAASSFDEDRGRGQTSSLCSSRSRPA
jgi:hypothetical protein